MLVHVHVHATEYHHNSCYVCFVKDLHFKLTTLSNKLHTEVSSQLLYSLY